LEDAGLQVFRQAKLGMNMVDHRLEVGGLQLVRQAKPGTDMIDRWLEDGVLKQLMNRPDGLMVGGHCSWDVELCFLHLQAKAGISSHSTC
jgi:hypothetical protein